MALKLNIGGKPAPKPLPLVESMDTEPETPAFPPVDPEDTRFHGPIDEDAVRLVTALGLPEDQPLMVVCSLYLKELRRADARVRSTADPYEGEPVQLAAAGIRVGERLRVIVGNPDKVQNEIRRKIIEKYALILK